MLFNVRIISITIIINTLFFCRFFILNSDCVENCSTCVGVGDGSIDDVTRGVCTVSTSLPGCATAVTFPLTTATSSLSSATPTNSGDSSTSTKGDGSSISVSTTKSTSSSQSPNNENENDLMSTGESSPLLYIIIGAAAGCVCLMICIAILVYMLTGRGKNDDEATLMRNLSTGNISSPRGAPLPVHSTPSLESSDEIYSNVPINSPAAYGDVP
mmetsp:Transcript_5419/g.9036  ORF Transcript_5419/g.9036 Transcript_5419/m.9036 type:complete len:214 (+) Transcript_5419:242-883(+)